MEDTWIFKLYKKVLGPLLESKSKRRLFMAVIVVLFAAVMSFPLLEWVQFRMLPKANKNTFLITVDMPTGPPSKRRTAWRAPSANICPTYRSDDYEAYVGVHSVVDFNGLLRGGSFRDAPQYADVRVNLVG